MWTEKHRPKTTNEYICGSRSHLDITLNYLNSIIDEKHLYDGLLYHGPPGTGKTTMTLILERIFKDKIGFVRCNASDERKKSDAMKLIQKGSVESFGRKTVLILDEAEGMSNLEKIIDNTNPIVIVNNKYALNKSARNKLTQLKFEHPPKDKKIEYIDRILRKEDEKISYRMKEEIAKNCKSFRQVASALQMSVTAEEVIVPEKDEYGLFEEVRRHFNGQEVRNSEVKPRELLEWAFDNSGSPELISALDRIMGRTKTNDYRDWKYIYSLISRTGARNPSYPYSWKMRGKIKREVKEEEKKKKKEKSEKEKKSNEPTQSKSFMDFVGDSG